MPGLVSPLSLPSTTINSTSAGFLAGVSLKVKERFSNSSSLSVGGWIVRTLPAKAQSRTTLADLDRQYTLLDVATITSAGPARALGLSNKGHLGVGADADLAIYNEKPDGEFLFRYPRYVIKAGVVVVEEGEIRDMSEGREFVVRPTFDETIEDYLRPLFQQYYTISFDNYPVEMERLERAEVVTVDGAR